MNENMYFYLAGKSRICNAKSFFFLLFIKAAHFHFMLISTMMEGVEQLDMARWGEKFPKILKNDNKYGQNYASSWKRHYLNFGESKFEISDRFKEKPKHDLPWIYLTHLEPDSFRLCVKSKLIEEIQILNKIPRIMLKFPPLF